MNKIHQNIMLPTKKQRLVEVYDGKDVLDKGENYADTNEIHRRVNSCT